jgi:hypothetical protein
MGKKKGDTRIELKQSGLIAPPNASIVSDLLVNALEKT